MNKIYIYIYIMNNAIEKDKTGSYCLKHRYTSVKVLK